MWKIRHAIDGEGILARMRRVASRIFPNTEGEIKFANYSGNLSKDVMKAYENFNSAYTSLLESKKWIDFPAMVSIETYARCNAACAFCPSPTLERMGTKMPEHIFEKIICELSAQKRELPTISLCRVNEPFLDKRIFDFLFYIKTHLPETLVSHFSNGSPLNDKVVDRLVEVGNARYLKISFNDHRPDEYQKVMHLPYERTIANLRRLHDRVAANEINFPIVLGRVGEANQVDEEFISFCRREFPLFSATVSPRFEWIGGDFINTPYPVPRIGCPQWFQMHILSTGRDAFCCIDTNGQYGFANVADENVVDIYNHPERKKLRLAILSRTDVDICKTCTFG